MASWILVDDLVLSGVNQPNPRPDGARIEFGLWPSIAVFESNLDRLGGGWGFAWSIDLDYKSKGKQLSKAKPVTRVPQPPTKVNENGR